VVPTLVSAVISTRVRVSDREIRLTRRLFGSGVPYDLLVLTPEEVEQRLRRNGPFIREILATGLVVYRRP
jgi:hypothetical protein